MTKLCARGKSAAKRKFKVYPSAYANAYASKICAGKIKDPSGTKRKDWGPKKMKRGLLAEKQPGPSSPKTPSTPQTPDTPMAPSQDIIDKAKKFKNKKPIPGDPNKRRKYMIDIQNPKSEYDEKGKLIYTEASQGKIMQVANKLEKASKAHAGQARTLKSLKLSRGGGIAIKGTNFKGVF